MRQTPILKALRRERVTRLERAGLRPAPRPSLQPAKAPSRSARLAWLRFPPNAALVCGLAMMPLVIIAGLLAERGS